MKAKLDEAWIKAFVNQYNHIAVKQGKPCLYCRNEIEERQVRCDMRHFDRVWVLDRVTVALGRMGFRQKRFETFNTKLAEVVEEYDHQFASDLKDDEQMIYSRDLLDRELAQYTGGFFKPEKERYSFDYED